MSDLTRCPHEDCRAVIYIDDRHCNDCLRLVRKPSAEDLWESAMRRTLKDDKRYQDPEALERRIAILKRRREECSSRTKA